MIPYVEQIVEGADGSMRGAALVQTPLGIREIHAYCPGAESGFLGGALRSVSRAAKRAGSVASNVARGRVQTAMRQATRLVTQDAAKLASNPAFRALQPLQAHATEYAARNPEQVAMIIPGVGPVAAPMIARAKAMVARARQGDPQAIRSLAALSRRVNQGDPKAAQLAELYRYVARPPMAVAGATWTTEDISIAIK